MIELAFDGVNLNREMTDALEALDEQSYAFWREIRVAVRPTWTSP